MKTILRYAGGKSKALNIITPYVKDYDTIISPFIGGGSLEVHWAGKLNKKVIGYDVFDVLCNFWNCLLIKPEALADELTKIKPTAEEYTRIKEILMTTEQTQEMLKDWPTNYYKRNNPIKLDDIVFAAYYFFNHNCSYGPGYLGWASKIYLDQNKWNKTIDIIRSFKLPNLEVNNKSFEESIKIHKNDFLYLDPPYFLEKDADNKMHSGIYPMKNIDVHHTGFDHEKLRDMLLEHEGDFVMSYNNCETIREYYKDFDFVFPEWSYSMSNGETRIGKNRKELNNEQIVKESHEILIIKKK
jgi:DNA adenine methylase